MCMCMCIAWLFDMIALAFCRAEWFALNLCIFAQRDFEHRSAAEKAAFEAESLWAAESYTNTLWPGLEECETCENLRI